MASAPKSPKDRPQGAAPRLPPPRPTAASAARAARIATNRNLSLNPTSSVRSPSRTAPSKTRYPASLRAPPIQKTESKPEIKAFVEPTSPPPEPEQCLMPEGCVDAVGCVDVVGCADSSSKEAIHDNAAHPSQVTVSETATNETFEIQQNQDEVVDQPPEVSIDQTSEPDKESSVPTELPTSKSFSLPDASRPQTPKSAQSSRPPTPVSAPVTPTQPAKPTSRPTTPAKTTRPRTPTRPQTPTRPKTPTSIPVPTPAKVQSANRNQERHAKGEEYDLKTEYAAKQRQFHKLKKDLDLKQQALLELFDNLRCLSERMAQEGKGACGEMVPIQDLVVFHVGDWTADEVAQLCRDALAASDTEDAIKVINTTKPIDETALSQIDSDVSKVPSYFADLCLQAFTARQELIDWIRELVGRMEDDGAVVQEDVERISQYNAQGLELCEALRELKARADEVMDTVTQISRRACQERSTLAAVGEALVREIARLRHDLEARAVIVNEMREMRAQNDTVKMLEATRRELEEERAANKATKEKLATTETHLRQTRARVVKMDRQLREAEASIASLTGSVKSLEDQSRQREVQLEARARKLKESLKTGEVANSHLAQQRDALQAKVQSLKEQIQQLSAQNQSTNDQIHEELKATIEIYKQESEKDKEALKQAQDQLQVSQAAVEELKAKLNELESTRPNPELPTEREMDLWAELQATKDTLRMTEEEVASCKREKVRFLETLTKISESENKVGIQQKLAAELLSKEEIISKMQMQIRDLTKNIRLNEQKVVQYEQYVRDSQAHARAVANCQQAPNGISYEDLQQEIMNLRMNLLDAVHRNEELSELLAQKEQQLDQQDKTSRAQARVIKVREELINMLKNKETEQSRELCALQQDLEQRMRIVDDVNKQIAAKADEIQELFTTLESKQQQIHRLEKIVLALEEQQRRGQAQRTRHEEKIAALEHELAAGGRNRERKFLFF